MSKYNFEQKRNDYLTPPELYNMALEWVGADWILSPFLRVFNELTKMKNSIFTIL